MLSSVSRFPHFWCLRDWWISPTSSLFSRISPDLQISPDLRSAGVTRHKKSELSAHQMASPGHLRTQRYKELLEPMGLR